MQCGEQVKDKLQWQNLLQHLADHAQTEDGRELCLGLKPNLSMAEVQDRWQKVEPLKDICDQGYIPPVGELPPFNKIIRALGVGALLEGPELRSIWVLLDSTARVQTFASDFTDRCSTLRQFNARLYALPKLAQAIDRAIGPDGELLDDASPELSRLRKQKLSMRKKIEERIRKLLRSAEVEQYVQDDFFTVRADRYVVPIRIDGRGRVKGKIYDTSDSGQTLFMEPTEIAPANEQLLEIELAEKLEILRIFRDLSGQAAGEVEVIKTNYDELIELDFLTAQGKLASDLRSVSVKLSESRASI